MKLTAIVGEVCKDNAEIDETGEHAGAETTDRGGSDFGEVDGADDRGLADAKTGDEAARVDGAEVAVS
ncbi:hypothetical protein HYQ46_007822 [Verticillium longisporum]|nr:hypothetical protein HYQ46_007822 [Verticillium longisporum]